MAPLPTIDNVARVAFNWLGAGQSAVNVMHFRGPSPVIDTADLAAKLDANFVSGMLDPISSAATVDTVDVTPLDGSSASATYAMTSWDGAGGGEFVPGLSVVISLQTALRGRSYRGRIFLPFTAEGAQNDGGISSAQASSVNGDWGTFIAAMAADSWQMVVASYKLATAEDVASTVVKSVCGSQRRRQSRIRNP